MYEDNLKRTNFSRLLLIPKSLHFIVDWHPRLTFINHCCKKHLK